MEVVFEGSTGKHEDKMATKLLRGAGVKIKDVFCSAV